MNKSKEEQMLVELQKNLNSKFLLRMLKRCWKKNHSLHAIGNIIGEVYIHHIIHKDGYGFKYYMKKIESLYQQRKENQMTSNEYYYQRARNIALVIGRKLGIKAKNPSQADREKIKIYFLEEFVAQGYVSHSFPAGYFDSIIKNGLTSSVEQREERPQDFETIQELFMKKGVMAPLGGYPYYNGSGLYYEYNLTNTFQHAIDSPEWFCWFTSSDHTTSYHQEVEVIPYILRSEKDCRKNVEDLCSNAGLDAEERDKVLDFYTENYEKFSSPTLMVAFISKELLKKNKIEEAVPNNLDLIDTIIYIFRDGAKQYKEHQGNVYHGTIPKEYLKITTLPDISQFIQVEKYKRETKEHLLDPKANQEILKQVKENQNRVAPKMKEQIEKIIEQ